MLHKISPRLIRRPQLLPLRRYGYPGRHLSTSSRSYRGGFRGFLVRLTLAGGAVYAYVNSNVFADEPGPYKEDFSPNLVEERKRPPSLLSEVLSRKAQFSGDSPTETSATALANAAHLEGQSALDSITESEHPLEEAAGGQEGAFNPETGEINWDCPCLGGMANGPCGESFKAAFSCFVYSSAEPKGIDCIEQFKAMQTCFQAHPDVYGTDDAETDPSPDPTATSLIESSPAQADDLVKEHADADRPRSDANSQPEPVAQDTVKT